MPALEHKVEDTTPRSTLCHPYEPGLLLLLHSLSRRRGRPGSHLIPTGGPPLKIGILPQTLQHRWCQQYLPNIHQIHGRFTPYGLPLQPPCQQRRRQQQRHCHQVRQRKSAGPFSTFSMSVSRILSLGETRTAREVHSWRLQKEGNSVGLMRWEPKNDLSFFQLYKHDDPECSELCECNLGEVLSCKVLECIERDACNTGMAFYSHASPFYQAYRGQCLCYSGSFVCSKPPKGNNIRYMDCIWSSITLQMLNCLCNKASTSTSGIAKKTRPCWKRWPIRAHWKPLVPFKVLSPTKMSTAIRYSISISRNCAGCSNYVVALCTKLWHDLLLWLLLYRYNYFSCRVSVGYCCKSIQTKI